MDDAYLGGERSGAVSAERGSPGKTPFVAAVETTEDSKAHRVKLRRVRRFTKKNIKKITGRIVSPRGSSPLGCFNGVVDAAAVQRTPQQRQVQERQLQLRARQARPQQFAPKQVEKGPSRPDVVTKPSDQPVARSQASDQQRREVRQRLFGNPGVQRISRRQLNVALAMGSRIPRRHRLYRFAPALLAIIPAYAAYQYLIVDDTICVVDPDSYAIVDVIPSSIEQAGPQSADRPALALSTDQMRCVYAATP